MIICEIKAHTFSHDLSTNISRHLLPSGRADLTTSASLQPIRSRSLQLMGHCLAATAISTRK